MAVKMNLRIITKNHAAYPEIGFLPKSISKPKGYATAMPAAWELRRFETQPYAKKIFFCQSSIIIDDQRKDCSHSL